MKNSSMFRFAFRISASEFHDDMRLTQAAMPHSEYRDGVMVW